VSQARPGGIRTPRLPSLTDVRVLGFLAQAAVVGVVAVLGWMLFQNLAAAMTARNLGMDPGILQRTANFEIAETFVDYSPADTYGRAFLVGLLNTMAVSLAGIVLATILGLVVGVARLSSNWLVGRLAAGFVEVLRNTPLLVQLFIIYFAVFLRLPPVRDSVSLPGSLFLNQRGLFMPRPEPTDTFGPWLLAVGAGIVLFVGGWIFSSRREAAGRPTYRAGTIGFLALIALPVLAWMAAPAPLAFEAPELGRFNLRGGLSFSPEFSALLLGLVVYTAAFIAEIVRGGILAVSRGQLEAARALGLHEGHVLRLVVLPQAMRIIVPPLTSQYLNLTKNSSLAIAIGYPDLFNVSQTIGNQTGQPVIVIVLVMATYLVISLATSVLMNVYNRRVQIRER
jgi:general L-amino acid transport system permease protein